MHAWDVITHGGGEGLLYTFNAVAAFFNGRHAGSSVGSIVASLTVIAGAFGTALAVFYMVVKQDIRLSFNWLFMSFILMNCLMIPKVNIIIIDRITGLRAPVANVPFLLGSFAGITSQLGDFLAKKTDDIFSGPMGYGRQARGTEVMRYREYGVAMASQLVAKASRFSITDPDMASNMREFVQQCVAFDIAKGKYTLADLLQNNDVWQLLKDNASPARGFPFKTISGGGVETKILTCREGTEKIEELWDRTYTHAKRIYGARFFPHKRDPGTALASNLEISYAYLTNLSMQASDILRQNMMINALEDGFISFNGMTDATAAVTGYAATRAQEQQKTAYALQGSMASLSLSVLKIVVEVMFYGIFPIIAVISILPGGVVVLKKYVIALFWIQSWAPLYSILNMLVNIYGRSKGMSAVSGVSGSALSMSTLPGLAEGSEWVSAVAGYAMMSVPFLSYGLIYYGAGALSQLATHFGSVTQSAASHAAEEATTGNYGMGNTNFDNHSRHNIQGFKQDTNMSVATGRTSLQLEDGSQVSTAPDGSVIFNRSSAISNIGGNINWNESFASTYSNMADKSQREGLQEVVSAQQNISAALNTAHDYRHTHGQGKNSDTTFSHGESAFENSAFSTFVDKSKQFAMENRISQDTADALILNASLKAHGSIGGKIPFTNIGGSISVDGGATAQNTRTHVDSELMSKSDSFVEKEGLSTLLQKSMSESKDMRFSNNESQNDAYSSSIAASLSDANSQLTSASASFSKENSYREASQKVSTQGTGFNQDMSQRYINWLSEQCVEGRQFEVSDVNHVLADENLNRRYMQAFVHAQQPPVVHHVTNPLRAAHTLESNYVHNSAEIKKGNNPEVQFEKDRSVVNQKEEMIQQGKTDMSGLAKQVSQRLDDLNAELVSKTKEMEKKNEH